MLLRLSDEFRKVCASVFGTGDEPPQCNIEPFTPTGTLPFKKDASSPNTVRFSAEEYTSLQLTHNFSRDLAREQYGKQTTTYGTQPRSPGHITNEPRNWAI